ncbi:MAG: competence protein ComK [Solobacterium sp.]|nr:competence protein ComK [Solobacterium sp.]
MPEEPVIHPSQVMLIRNTQDGQAECLLMDRRTLHVSCTAAELLEHFCLQYGSTMKGRQDAFRMIMHTRQKTPVMISHSSRRIFFPVVSPDDPDCVWLCSNEILKCRNRGNGRSTVMFMNGDEYELDHDARTLLKQMKRCEKYLQMFT